jgi:hypothetical protein
MIGKVLSWFLYFGFLAIVVVTGWQEPLKYRFQAPTKEVPTLQSSAQDSLLPTSTPSWMSDPNRWDTARRLNQPYPPASTPQPAAH